MGVDFPRKTNAAFPLCKIQGDNNMRYENIGKIAAFLATRNRENGHNNWINKPGKSLFPSNHPLRSFAKCYLSVR
jgi:hypothetical protein